MHEDWTARAVSPEDAVSLVKSGMSVYVQGTSATPIPLLTALARRPDLENVRTYHIHLEGPCEFTLPENSHKFRPTALFTGPQLRKPVEQGLADFMPIFLSDIPSLFSTGRIPLDVAIIQVSRPDKHGFCTLGTSVDCTLAAVRAAKVIIAEINDQMPLTRGNTLLPFNRIKAFIHTNRPLPAHDPVEPDPVESAIGEHIAPLVPDGATLQMGIGAIPEAVLARLFDKKDLGVFTEMFSDRVIDLVEAGVITNRLKKVHNGRITATFCVGSKRLYDFVDDNPFVEFYPCDHTNDTAVIRRNDKMVAINSALEIDLTGQVSADSIGHRIYSGIGGQMDFMRGAALSNGGVPIIAIPSTAGGGRFSRIVTTLKPGAGVVTTRGHVHWIVTEHGAVRVWGLTLRERAEALISIAHPDFRAELRREISEIRHFDLAQTAATQHE